ncbi:MAG: FtsX-like permease family protein [Alphaproteobacteria bacterium]|nr:MAG: FtsX-like permease family protein [Alphaproteobacteria bacterium]
MPLYLQWALRELRGGLRGFGVFLSCIILGVAAIASVGGLRDAVMVGINENGQVILGGDVELRQTNLPIEQDIIDYLGQVGRVGQTITMRGMAASVATGERTLVEIKSVDGAYPLYGALKVEAPSKGMADLALQDGAWGVLVDQSLLDYLGLALGNQLKIGDLAYVIRGVILREPDRAADGFTMGARTLVAHASMSHTGLIRPGSLMRYNYRVALPEGVETGAFLTTLNEKFPDGGWRVRDRNDSAPSVRTFLDRLAVFLSLAGLTTLVVGGVGVANATTGFLASKREAIATLKSMGATGDLIFKTYLTQIMLIAMVGVVGGLVIGAIAPSIVLYYLADLLPIPAEPGLYPAPLMMAGAYGVVTVLAFATWPLGKARDVSAAGLFRQIVAPSNTWPRKRYIALIAASAAGLAGLATLFSGEVRFAGWFLIGVVVCFSLLLVAGLLIMKVASVLPRPKNGALRMALANIHRPGSVTPNIVLSLGLGLTLLVTIAQIEGNLSAQINEALPKDAPSFFFIGLQPDQVEEFDALLQQQKGVTNITRAPMLRAAISRIKGVPVADALISPEAKWAVRGDRGLSYLTTMPRGNVMIEGEWWPEDYAGPPIISLDEQLANGMGLTLGDTMSFNIMGRNVSAEIVSIRRIDWTTMGMNFSIIFAPGTLERAPHSHMAAIKVSPEQEGAVEKVMAEHFPDVTSVRLREVLKTVNKLVGDIGMAIRGAASAALIAGVLVLAGAVAAGYHDRVRDSVILKVLGATRRQVAMVYLLEYALMGLVTALAAMGLGTLAAWLVMTGIMGASWVWQPWVLIGTALGGMFVTILFGFLGTWRALGAKAAPILRTE